MTMDLSVETLGPGTWGRDLPTEKGLCVESRGDRSCEEEAAAMQVGHDHFWAPGRRWGKAVLATEAQKLFLMGTEYS